MLVQVQVDEHPSSRLRHALRPPSRALPQEHLASVLLRRNLCRAYIELGIEFAGLLPAQYVERFNEFADAVDLGAEQPELDDLFVAKMLSESGINLVFVDGMLALFEQICIMQLPSHAR